MWQKNQQFFYNRKSSLYRVTVNYAVVMSLEIKFFCYDLTFCPFPLTAVKLQKTSSLHAPVHPRQFYACISKAVNYYKALLCGIESLKKSCRWWLMKNKACVVHHQSIIILFDFRRGYL